MAAAITDTTAAQRALKRLFDTHHRVVFFGGAGVSTASSIPDFRSVDGLYHQHFKYPPETMLSHSFYVEHPAEFFEFYRTRMIAPAARPNRCHEKLAELERASRLHSVVTQNIDGLHQMAGSRHVWELHGSVHRNICQRCGAVYDAAWVLDRSHDNEDGVPFCPTCGGRIKPDVVLSEEPLSSFLRAEIAGRPGLEMKGKEFRRRVKELAGQLDMDTAYLNRELGVGFSGGEKKKVEMLQLLLLQPKLAILDETDSGLDVDALGVVSRGIDAYKKATDGTLVIITHNTRILEHLHVDRVHVMVAGRIVKEGGADLIPWIDEHGFESFEQVAGHGAAADPQAVAASQGE